MIGTTRSLEAQLDLGLHMRQVILVEAVEIEDALVVGHVIRPRDVLAEVAVAGDRQQAELLQDHLEHPRSGQASVSMAAKSSAVSGHLPVSLKYLWTASIEGMRPKKAGALARMSG